MKVEHGISVHKKRGKISKCRRTKGVVMEFDVPKKLDELVPSLLGRLMLISYDEGQGSNTATQE